MNFLTILYINSVSLCVRAFVCRGLETLIPFVHLSRSWNPDQGHVRPSVQGFLSVCLFEGFCPFICSSVRGFLSVCLSKQISTSNYLELGGPLKFFHPPKLEALFDSVNFQIPKTDGSEFFKSTDPVGM